MKNLKSAAALFLYSALLQGQTTGPDWPLFRGKSDLAGYTEMELPGSPSLIWSYSAGSRTKSSPVSSEGLIFFGDEKGIIHGVTQEGKSSWKFETGSRIEAPPLVFGDKVIVGSSDGIMRAIGKLNGRFVWAYPTDNQIVGSANAWGTGTRAGIVFGSYDFYLHCIDPSSGKRLWRLETDNYVNGTPAISANNIVFGGCDGIIRIADPFSGLETDTIEIGVYIAASPSIVSGKAYFGDYDGNFYCLDLRTKKIAWRIPPGESSGSILGIPAIKNNYVVIGNEDKYLYCYNATTGNPEWKFRTNGRITGSAVITPTKVIAGSADGYIYILNLADGKKLWSFNAGAPVSSSPVVLKDRFYILTEDGRLLAFGTR